MARGFSGAVMRAFGAQDYAITVVDKEQRAAHCIRIRFHSDTLFDVVSDGPTSWIRCWFPDDSGKEFQRAYTFSEVDAPSGRFALDFVLHEPAGPASNWARSAEPGDELAVNYMSSVPLEIPQDAPPAGYLLIGDSASIPAINTIIAAMPPEIPVEAYLEEHEPADRELPINPHPRLRVHWVHRAGAHSLADALEPRDWSNWYAWAGPEQGSLKLIRARLKEFGFPRSETHALAYWSQGKAMGKERAPVSPESDGAASPSEPDGAAPASGVQAPETGSDGAVIRPDPRPDAPSKTPAPQGHWRAAGAGRLLAPLKRTLILAGVAQAVVTLLQFAPYLLLIELSRRLLDGAPAADLWSIGVLAIVLLGVGTLLESALMLWLHAVDARFSRDLRGRLLGKLARLPLGWFSARSSGGVKTLIQDNTLALHYLVTHATLDAVSAVVAPIAVLVYLFTVDWGIALFLLLPVLGYVIAMYRMVIGSSAQIPQHQAWVDRMGGEAGAYLDAQPVIRVFGGVLASGFQRSLDGYIDFLAGWQRPFVRTKTVMDIVTRPTTFLWVIASAGTLFVIQGWTRPVDLVPFLLLGATFGVRLLGIGYGLSGLRSGMIAARDLQTVLDEPELATRAPSGDDAAAVAPGAVEVRGVTFGYRPDVPVLHDISMSLAPGTVTALVGPSGSGKSTLAALLARFHDVDAGTISVGGRDISTLTADELYARLGFVLQQTQLVVGTVAENIALADPDATPQRIEDAARAANIHERILRMPQGYDTPLGRDPALSGGERQRLTIARAILADAPVLVLDEATAFADPESEYLVQESLSRLAAGRTVLVIAHRLHTVADADAIVVLDGGRIVEHGTHDDLLAAGGAYRSLWDAARPAAPSMGQTR
ncbi:ABC transporter ATP-binding protein/permease [Tsukamurella spumae]|uniref:Mycobactin import ATP-binding/permease protein IrtA n=1 Tax=Tsukamurella spumae TaxID=44753 RepID=A0A846X2H2_9ACTN|nr:ABC transporter ATP-binding protein/permease [Tsukamurella spumae]NKY18412.1 ATP-binding cassette domain-containing protein [Tsukamurella spumae]